MPQLKYTVAKVMPLLNLPLLEKRAIIFWTNFLTYLQNPAFLFKVHAAPPSTVLTFPSLSVIGSSLHFLLKL